MKVLLKLPVSPFSGYGNDGIGIVQAFMRRGDDVYLQPTDVEAPIPAEIAQLLTKELKAPFDLYLNHVDPMRLEVTPQVARVCGVNVAWTMWEYSNLLNMDPAKLKTLRERLEHFDVFAGYSDVDPPAFEPYYDGPIIVQQGGFEPTQWPELVREDSDREFRFFMIGVLSERKDPHVAIRAFQEARARDEQFRRWARLSLKTTAPGLHHKIEDLFRDTDDETGEEYTAVRVFYDVWPTEIVRDFYAVQDVLVAPSRGEGKNMPALEFMSTGGTVIATDWAGHRQWLSPEYAYPLDYELKPESIEHRETFNARASVEHLTELMLHTFHNRAEVRNKGRIAAQVIPAMSSWDRVIERLLERIREAVPEKGERLWTLAQMTEAPRGNG